MDERLVDYYDAELRHVRQMAREFAREFPKIAGRMGLGQESMDSCSDPYVERLLEGFALLAARVHLSLDSEFPRLTHALLERIYPLSLSPVPSMGVVCFEPDPSGAEASEGFLLTRGTTLRASGRETSCQYQTSREVRLYPLSVADCRYYSREVVELDLPDSIAAKAAFVIRLQALGPQKLGELAIERLPFFIRGSDQISMMIYEQISANRTNLILQSPANRGGWRQVLSASAITQVGFRQFEQSLPSVTGGFDGYRLLKEFFACPQSYLFFEVAGLKAVRGKCEEDQLEIIIPLSRAEPRLDHQVNQSSFALFCSPAVNLFRKQLDPVLVSDSKTEFRISPENNSPHDYEIYGIDEVVGLVGKTNEEQRFEPVKSARGTEGGSGAYYKTSRVPRVLSAREKRSGGASAYSGSDVQISLLEASGSPYQATVTQLHLTTFCTNCDLPVRSSTSGIQADLATELFAPVKSVGWVAGPTMPVPATIEGDPSWQCISHLSQNYLSVSDRGERNPSAGLRDLLRVFVAPSDLSNLRRIDGIVSIESRPLVGKLVEGGSLTFARGLEIRVTFNDEVFEDSGLFLFGAVLTNFLAYQVSTNSFIEAVIVSPSRGEIIRWPRMKGRRPVI